MTLKRRSLSIAILFFLISLACSGIDSAPANTPTALPVFTATPAQGGGPTKPDNLETVAIARIIDGDTVELADGRRVRYIGINTPERGQPYYQDASDTNRQLVGGKTVQLELDVETLDKYGRALGYIWADGVMVNLEIVRRGFANAFTVPPNVRYQEEFRGAEREAREAERGLWAGSDVALKIVQIQADAPGSDRENPNGEWIEITNQGFEPVQIQGYTLKDEANHIYTFGNFALQAGASFRLYSGQGQNSNNALYWGFVGESVWNNGSDAAFLRDNQGRLVDTFAY